MFLSHRRGDRLTVSMDILSSVQEQHLLVWRDFYSEGLLSGRDKGSGGPRGHKTCEWLRIKEEKAFLLRRKGKEGQADWFWWGEGQRTTGQREWSVLPGKAAVVVSQVPREGTRLHNFMLTRAQGQAGFSG